MGFLLWAEDDPLFGVHLSAPGLVRCRESVGHDRLPTRRLAIVGAIGAIATVEAHLPGGAGCPQHGSLQLPRLSGIVARGHRQEATVGGLPRALPEGGEVSPPLYGRGGQGAYLLLLQDLYQDLSLDLHRRNGGKIEEGVIAGVGALKAIDNGLRMMGWLLIQRTSKVGLRLLIGRRLVQVEPGLLGSLK